MNRKLLYFFLIFTLSSSSFSNDSEREYNEIIENLRCLVCQNQSLSESDSNLAKDLRSKVRGMLDEGKSDKEIYKFMADRYTDYVLYNPPLKSSTLILWYGPFIILVLSLIYIFFIFRRKNSEGISLKENNFSENNILAKSKVHTNKYIKVFLAIFIPIFAVLMYISSSEYMKYKVSNFFVSKEPVIDVTVLIHEEILTKITGNEVLFVYARRSNGMRVPLAIDISDVALKKNSYNVKLDNTMNMLENQTLSSAKEVIIEARISKTKRAMVIPGDFIGISKPIKLKASNYLLLKINSIVTEE